MILVTGFEPHAGMASNPAEDVARTLEERDVNCCILPIEYETFEARLADALAPSWDAVVMLGLAADRGELCLERIARNNAEPGRRDNTGRASLRQRLVADGPAAYFSTLPIEDMHRRLEREGFPARLSGSAGDDFGNAAFYLARHLLGPREIPCGFVHLPPTPDIAEDVEGVPLSTQVAAVTVLLDELRDL